MSILGKKYPESEESFKNTRLDGFFDPQLAGQRMRLKTAYTWETELSKMGNVAAAWEGLISSRKLPYMAGLRNMRNIFLSDINPEICGKYLNYLKNSNTVTTFFFSEVKFVSLTPPKLYQIATQTLLQVIKR